MEVDVKSKSQFFTVRRLMFQLRRESQNFSPEKVIIVLVETLSHEIVIKIQFFNSREII